MAQVSLDRALPRRSALDVGVDRVWRFFCSVRAAVWEMAVLTVLVLIGTLRGSSVPFWLAERVPALSGLVDRWYAWEVFGSFPFMATLTILAVAIAICTANRGPAMWASIANPTVPTTHGFLRNADVSVRFTGNAGESREAFVARLSGALAGARYRVLAAGRDGETHVYADRYRWGKLGTIPFHLGLIMVLIGAIVGARWGFREATVIIPEGVTQPVGHETGLAIRVDDFSENFRETGIPSEYRSDLTILRGDEPVKSGSITVNYPLTYGNVVIYQSGFGQAAQLRIDDGEGRPLFDEPVPLGLFQAKMNPDAPAAVMDIVPAKVQLTVIAPDVNPPLRPELDRLQLRPGQMFLQLRPLPGNTEFTEMVEARIDQGKPFRLGGLDYTFVRESRFTVLQVASNPGIPIVIAASVLMLAGLAVTFYFPHRRLRGIVGGAPDGRPVVHLAPLARKDWSAKRSFAVVTAEVELALSAPAERMARGLDGPPAAAAPGAVAAAAAAD